ncbi:MAG: hypothetical protein AAF533_17270, partial [Acidobacteriota bacterium]
AVGRIPGRSQALRWLRAVASTVADWGGSEGREALASCLPAKALKGGGSSGRSYAKALEAEGEGGEETVFHVEVGRRVGEQDPGKIAVALRPILGLVRSELGEEQVATLEKVLPEPVAEHFRKSTTDAPWAYRLVPQPFGAGRRRHA